MKTDQLSIPKTSSIYGSWTAVFLIAYFFLMQLLQLIQVIEFRVFNFFILLTGVYFAVKNFKKKRGREFDYFQGLLLAFFTVAISVLIFGTFIFGYLLINHDMMDAIVKTTAFGEYLSPYTAAAVILVEGISSGTIIALTVMQLFKDDSRPVVQDK